MCVLVCVYTGTKLCIFVCVCVYLWGESNLETEAQSEIKSSQ